MFAGENYCESENSGVTFENNCVIMMQIFRDPKMADAFSEREGVEI